MFDSRLRAEDQGNRLDHLMQLHDLWSWSLAMCLRSTFHTVLEKEQQEKLEHALEMLNHIIMGYQTASTIPQVINSLPREARIIGRK
jgi:hypothetical protein